MENLETTGETYECDDCKHRWTHLDDRCPECSSYNWDTAIIVLTPKKP